MRVLVTGAAGFVGRQLSAYLESVGDVVVGVDRSDGPDVGDGAGWVELAGRVAPDAVYHLGGWSDVGASWDEPGAAFRVNAEGTLHVLQACVASGCGAKVLVVSSADVYGQVAPEALPIGEGAALSPITPYAASKVAADYLGLQAHLGYGLEVVRARAFNHLGPGQTTRFVAPAIADRIAVNEAAGGEVVPVGNLTPRRDFTDVRDVVRAYRALIVAGVAGEAYNVCSGSDLSIGELAERLVGLASAPMRLVADPELQRPVETPVLRGDNSKLTAATGWAPTIPLEVTLGDILEERRLARQQAPSTS